MADWISSKLKAAETFFEHIDHQAAESLKKNEKSLDNPLNDVSLTKTGGSVPLKDQLKKRLPEKNEILYSHSDIHLTDNPDLKKEVDNISKLDLKSKAKLTDSDWTKLLSSPTQIASSTARNSNNGVSSVRRLTKNARKENKLSSGPKVLRNQKSNNNLLNSVVRSHTEIQSKVNGKSNDVRESSSSESVGRTSSVELQTDRKKLERWEMDNEDVNGNAEGKCEEKIETDSLYSSKDVPSEDTRGPSVNKNHSMEMVFPAKEVDSLPLVKMGGTDIEQVRSTVRKKHETNVVLARAAPNASKQGSSTSDEASDVDTDSGSSSGSESEHEREERRRRRERILAEKMAARAVEAIRERENTIARMEGEKQSLEKILDERAKQQAKEASELQMTMMETMDAVELEKQKHNNTRMEALEKMAKLETANADIARLLASTQWNLEVEVNHIAELRQQIELKELGHEELKRTISKFHHKGTPINQLTAPRGFEFEREILEDELAHISDKIGCLQEKAKKLEVNIEIERKEIEDPTEVELELKQRLGQLTDHLIQKQAQVESLSSEKATLLFRIEAISRLVDENKSVHNSSSSIRDIESGTWELANSKLRPMFEDRIHSGRKHLGSLIQQLDAIFLAGALFLRRNSSAKLGSVIYLGCLHLWVLYILMSHSQPSNETTSGAVISLENINITAGV